MTSHVTSGTLEVCFFPAEPLCKRTATTGERRELLRAARPDRGGGSDALFFRINVACIKLECGQRSTGRRSLVEQLARADRRFEAPPRLAGRVVGAAMGKVGSTGQSWRRQERRRKNQRAFLCKEWPLSRAGHFFHAQAISRRLGAGRPVVDSHSPRHHLF